MYISRYFFRKYNHAPELFCVIHPSVLLKRALLIRSVFVIAWCWFRIATGGFLECSMGFLHLQRGVKQLTGNSSAQHSVYISRTSCSKPQICFCCFTFCVISWGKSTGRFVCFFSLCFCLISDSTSERINMKCSEKRTRSTFCSFHCEAHSCRELPAIVRWRFMCVLTISQSPLSNTQAPLVYSRGKVMGGTGCN